MPVNPYFNFTTFVSEQKLVEDLIIESIKVYGHSTFYIPRETADLDRLFGEDPLAHFDHLYELEMYLKSNIQFQGSSEILSKFGMVIQDDATFLVAVARFGAELAGVLDRPREGDIVYIEFTPTNRYLFEIKFVENKEQLFQLGKLYTFELQCELMNYSSERVQTGNTEVNEVAQRGAYTVDIVFSSGVGAYQVGEVAYQGSSFVAATAHGTVVDWNANTLTLSVQTVVGEFGNANVIGVTSSAEYIPVGPADTAPIAHDPLSENDLYTEEAPTIVQPRSNPRYTG